MIVLTLEPDWLHSNVIHILVGKNNEIQTVRLGREIKHFIIEGVLEWQNLLK
jgi:hypothetical protein